MRVLRVGLEHGCFKENASCPNHAQRWRQHERHVRVEWSWAALCAGLLSFLFSQCAVPPVAPLFSLPPSADFPPRVLRPAGPGEHLHYETAGARKVSDRHFLPPRMRSNVASNAHRLLPCLPTPVSMHSRGLMRRAAGLHCGRVSKQISGERSHQGGEDAVGRAAQGQEVRLE